MKTTQKLLAITLVLLLGGTIYALFRTGQPSALPSAATSAKSNHTALGQAQLVDQSPLKTAQGLAQMPTSAEEQSFAEEALRLADHDMDLAFAAAVRAIELHPPALSAEAKEIQARRQQAEKALEADKEQISRLTAAEGKASGAQKDALDDQLDVAKAQQELDQDEVDEANEDLIRAGGDPKARVEAMIQEHEAASHVADTAHVAVSAPAEKPGLIERFQQWSSLHQKQLQLWQAKSDSDAAIRALTAQHNALDAQLEEEKTKTPELARHAKHANPAERPSNIATNAGRSPAETAELLIQTKLLSGEQKLLTTFDKRIGAHKELSDDYRMWINVIAVHQRTVINHALRGVLIILFIALILIFFDRWLEKLLGRTSLDRRQVETLRTVTSVSLQVVAVLFILLVIFGPPGQLGTFLGLAGAGLTVALKDFIVAFIGWLVLMGKDGIRLGDWVEINGVSGEVVQLGMFHTVLLETGNWTDSGHPTGRRVTFTNSFAIEGHYFNFSTSGQWLWDELQLVIPSGQDPYPIVDAIQKKVLETTADSARQAEQEWQHAARSRDMKSLSAAPAINVKPIIGGIEIAVRYITRANERYQLRAKLYQAAVDLLGGKNVTMPQVPAGSPASSTPQRT
jgi:small-conductance mechanosensitive channel